MQAQPMYEWWNLHPVWRELPLSVPRLRRTTLWNKSVSLMSPLSFFLSLPVLFFHLFSYLPFFFLSNFTIYLEASVCDFFCHSSVGSSRSSSRGDLPRPAGLKKKSRQKKSHQELLHHYRLHRRRHAAW